MNFRALGLLIAVATMVVGCNERSLRPLTPCTISGVSNKLGSDINEVDMLFMIDTSNSMASEQALLATALGPMVQALISGEVGACPDPDPTICQTFRPVKSLRVGVITPDLGIGSGTSSGCTQFGNDGRLFNDQRDENGAVNITPTPGTMACATGGDPWLEFNEGDDAGAFDTAFTCLANVGTKGCGFEQQLEAVLKSIAGERAEAEPLTFADFDGSGTAGHMSTTGYNQGFIRANSLVSLIVVTDEDDCSSTSDSLYDTSNITNELGQTWTNWSTLRWGGTSPADENDPTASEVNSVSAAASMMTEVDSALNCHLEAQILEETTRYIEGILDTRVADQRDLIVYSVIGGIDQDVVDAARTASADEQMNPTLERFQIMLDDPSMAETIDYDYRDRNYFGNATQTAGRVSPACRRFEAGSATAISMACTSNWQCAKAASDAMETNANRYECNDAGDACDIPNIAAPARRLVEVAQGIERDGGSSVVESICQDNFNGALSSIIAKMASILNRACLPVALNPTAAGTVNCDVVEFLPPTGDITTCQQAADMVGGREPVAIRTEDGREVCRINQIAIDRAAPSVPIEADDGIGWYYDDFTINPDDIGTGPGQVETAVGDICSTFDTAQRIAFTASGKPISGASIKLECLQPTVGGDLMNAEVATPCPWTAADDTTPICTGAVADTRPLGMICDSLSNTCQFACTNDAECPGGFVCYTREEAAPEGRLSCTADGDCTDPDGIGATTCGASGVCITDAEVASTRPFCANPTCDSTGIGD